MQASRQPLSIQAQGHGHICQHLLFASVGVCRNAARRLRVLPSPSGSTFWRQIGNRTLYISRLSKHIPQQLHHNNMPRSVSHSKAADCIEPY